MFPFRFKLTLLVSALIVMLLGGIYVVVQDVLEKEFIVEIKKELRTTDQLVARLMNDRRVSLENQTTTLSVNRLVRDIYTDKNLDKETANDLVTNEILPNFPLLRSLSVVSPEGKLLAADPLGEAIKDNLFSSTFFASALAGNTVSGHLFFRDIVLQYVGTPVFLREELLGVLFAAVVLDRKELHSISDVSGIEILLFKDNKPFISTAWSKEMSQQQLLYENLSEYFTEMPMGDRVEQIVLLEERYLYIRTDDDTAFIPRYLLSISLDRKLAFSQKIYSELLFIGFIGILIGIILSFLFARSISRPILQLQDMTKRVEKEDFTCRVSISSNDEFSQLGNSFNKMIAGLEEKEKIRGVINKVVSKDVADVLLAGEVKLGGENRMATILFTDIRGFTQLSEGMAPDQLLDFLNDYFTRVSSTIDNHHGVIDKFIGDAIMTLYGVPISCDQDAYDAILTAQDMIDCLAEFNTEIGQLRGVTLDIGIGINTGEVVAGNIGAQNRLNYTVIGDEVNMASRLEGLTKHYGAPIIISESTRQEINASKGKDELHFRELDSVRVKGKTGGTLIYQVFSRQQAEFPALTEHIKRFKEAHTLMLSMQFSEAYDQFEQLTSSWPEDLVAEIFRERCGLYREQPEAFQQHYQEGVFIFEYK